MNVNPDCTICGAKQTDATRQVWSPYVDHQYTLYHCSSCRSYFFDVNEHPVDLQDLYDNHYRGVDEQFRWSPVLARRVSQIKLLLAGGGSSPLDILDVGCNTGRFLLHWGREHHLYGVELSKPAATIAEQRGVIVQRCSAVECDFDRQFDVVCCFALLEHLSNPRSFLKKLTLLTKPRGILAILIPTIECRLRQKLDRRRVQWHMYSPPEHLAFYSRHFLDRFFSKHGYQLRKRRYSSGGFAPGHYTRMGRSYAYLHDTNHQKLQMYHRAQATPSRLSRMIATGMNTLAQSIELVTPIGLFPYYDHMYSYWQRDTEPGVLSQ